MGETHTGRTIFRITGADRETFLQGLVTNDVRNLDAMTYAALLTPQGKYLADFILVAEPEAILIDVKAEMAGPLLRRLGDLHSDELHARSVREQQGGIGSVVRSRIEADDQPLARVVG